MALYGHVLVDEYQDLNRAEQAVVDLLSAAGHLCIVGDDDQSLYSFKFAHPAGIRTFPATHNPTADHEILECRRCPTRVVAIANALVSNNQDREPRQLTPVPENSEGQVQIFQFSAAFDGGRITSEAGAMLLGPTDRPRNISTEPVDNLVHKPSARSRNLACFYISVTLPKK
jgi:superfamily I DNA/RNA helicase